jgi:hypothetical protein
MRTIEQEFIIPPNPATTKISINIVIIVEYTESNDMAFVEREKSTGFPAKWIWRKELLQSIRT